MSEPFRLKNITINGYRPFSNFNANVEALEVLIGANGSGKSSLFEFLRFLRDSVHQEIPPEIIAGSIGQQIFHIPGPEKLSWSLEIDNGKPVDLLYEGELMGPIGQTKISYEKVLSAKPFSEDYKKQFIYMDIRGMHGVIQDPESKKFLKQEISLKRPNQLTLSIMTNPAMKTLYELREYIREWRFYSSFNIANQKIRKSVPIEQYPVLHEDAGNLSSVLHFLMTEHRKAFDEMVQSIRLVVPGFQSLTVKARGGPGEVIAFWREEGVESELSLADLSDGILRLLCWAVICVQPNPPTLICIDEPDQGVHPRTLPVLADLFAKVSDRTQLFLSTHSSFFLLQFELSQLAILRKENGCARFIKPSNSAILRANLEDFGQEELEIMHRNDELERLS
ncbi:MAG: AAA family ATPase [Desulfitobacteriaceae bacterium]